MIFKDGLTTDQEPYVNNENIYIGPFVSVGKNTEIKPGVTIAGGVYIGENCLIAPGVSIVRGQKEWIKIFNDNRDKNMIYEAEAIELPTPKIHNNVFIGANSVIAGLGINDNITILPLTYVNRALKEKGTYAGNPVKMIRPYPMFYRK